MNERAIYAALSGNLSQVCNDYFSLLLNSFIRKLLTTRMLQCTNINTMKGQSRKEKTIRTMITPHTPMLAQTEEAQMGCKYPWRCEAPP